MNKINENELLEMYLYITVKNGKPALVFRKEVCLCDKNIKFFKKIIEVSLRENPDEAIIHVPATVRFNDRIRAISKLQELGIKIKKYEKSRN